MPTLQSRIETLERQNRNLRASFLLSLFAMVTCGGVTSNYERVNANTLVIRDAKEQPKITLSADGTITFHDGAPVVLDAQTVRTLVATGHNSAEAH